MNKTKIEWADATWNPVTGCTPASPGCAHCYARRMATRLAGRYGYPQEEPFRVTVHPERMEEPLRWKHPRRVFVCSMGDLFHEDVPADAIRTVYEVMDAATHHTYIVLTKRPERIGEFLYGEESGWLYEGGHLWPNIWYLATVEMQTYAKRRIGALLELRDHAPWPVVGVSVEPMLGPVDLRPWLPELQWVICGAETGPNKRPAWFEWIRALRDQCVAAGVPFFFKRNIHGGHDIDGEIWEQWPVSVFP